MGKGASGKVGTWESGKMERRKAWKWVSMVQGKWCNVQVWADVKS